MTILYPSFGVKDPVARFYSSWPLEICLSLIAQALPHKVHFHWARLVVVSH